MSGSQQSHACPRHVWPAIALGKRKGRDSLSVVNLQRSFGIAQFALMLRAVKLREPARSCAMGLNGTPAVPHYFLPRVRRHPPSVSGTVWPMWVS